MQNEEHGTEHQWNNGLFLRLIYRRNGLNQSDTEDRFGLGCLKLFQATISSGGSFFRRGTRILVKFQPRGVKGIKLPVNDQPCFYKRRANEDHSPSPMKLSCSLALQLKQRLGHPRRKKMEVMAEVNEMRSVRF